MTHPKYMLIANSIEFDIAHGVYLGRLPFIKELAKKYHTSKVTICKALQYLTLKGLIRPVKGHGCFICDTPLSPLTR